MKQTTQLKNIVLIDDEDVTNLINTKIISLYYEANIVSYSSAQVALEHFKGTDPDSPTLPDYIFLDINMPVMDGWEFLSEFQKFPLHKIGSCKIYMLSSSIDRDDIEKTKTFPSTHGFISKPLTKEKLAILE
ncbi:MAG: response regulator [Bacteroidota bacterium]